MEPEIILIIVFITSLIILKMRSNKYDFATSGRVAMSAMLIVTSIGHFLFSEGMIMIIPDFIPYKVGVVYLTGIIEIGAAVGLCMARFRTMTAWMLIILFILVLPANIYEAVKHVPFRIFELPV